jgi:hypothetical protein
LEAGIATLQQSLDALASVPLSREIRLTLRGDILARYQRIAALYRRYPGIEARIQAVETKLNSEGAPSPNGVGPIETAQRLHDINVAIDALVQFLQHGETLRPIPPDVRKIFLRELGERRAEANARWHLTQSRDYAFKGDAVRAQAHVTTLMQLLRRGPGTQFVHELYAEAERALVTVFEKNAAVADDRSADNGGNQEVA